jgi:hypothetical protein
MGITREGRRDRIARVVEARVVQPVAEHLRVAVRRARARRRGSRRSRCRRAGPRRTPAKRAKRSSASWCARWCPLTSGEAPAPAPKASMARAPPREARVAREPEVVVAGEVEDLAGRRSSARALRRVERRAGGAAAPRDRVPRGPRAAARERRSSHPRRAPRSRRAAGRARRTAHRRAPTSGLPVVSSFSP